MSSKLKFLIDLFNHVLKLHILFLGNFYSFCHLPQYITTRKVFILTFGRTTAKRIAVVFIHLDLDSSFPTQIMSQAERIGLSEVNHGVICISTIKELFRKLDWENFFQFTNGIDFITKDCKESHSRIHELNDASIDTLLKIH